MTDAGDMQETVAHY